jgi:hypothetical protein
VPVTDRQLRGDDNGPVAIALLEALEKILLLPVGKAAEAEVVEDDDRELGEAFEGNR